MAHITTWEDNGVHWDVSGELDSDEVVEFNEELSNCRRLTELTYFIWDSSKVTIISADKDDAALASVFGKLISKYNEGIKGAFVASDCHLKALVQEYIDYAKGLDSAWELMLFEDADDARKWVAS